MNEVDQLTLELFTNKTQYKKYLSKIDPEKYLQIEEFREKCIENKDKILEKTEKLLLTYHFRSDFVEEPFYRYVNEIMKEIEKEKEDANKYDSDNAICDNYEDSDDMLFPPNKMNEYELNEEYTKDKPIAKNSFWGKERVIQRDSDDGFISHYPTNTSVRRRLIGRRNSILPNDK
jgi:hypothetical protein